MLQQVQVSTRSAELPRVDDSLVALGQAVATAHVRTHAPGVAAYALQAVQRTGNAEEVDAALTAERVWQRQRLRELGEA